ncbi:MAG: N-6 DNA methylase, partial [Sedimentisphaerales bacterium]
FKNAFLPYRDPETLRLFLKEISVFTYDHSERLGDAFEYLLSVLGSQGKAGQFRTPRHIIDFIVEIVAPQKHETVLDPACGTAGFLISAYKHITANNKKLNPDQKKRLLNNIIGYDIDPGMVRLSLVNMYLHGFKDPHIIEYDTLTSEDRWQDTFDVIMANPPFMTPKGGIRPHSRFSIKANRSEVLFIDYIAEHLNPSGRAAIIVPEGIVFNSQNTYKRLRKMLIENYLWAVVSLPAGVFNPYSGTKTCILLMDKSLAKRIDKILFVKIENDGFDLGAQRRPIDKNDLPLAQKCLNIYKSKIENHKLQIREDSFAHAVPKSEIAKSGDYNLSGDRYRSFEHHHKSEFELVQFDKICTLEYGKSLPESKRVKGEYPVVGSNGITGWHNEYLIKGPAIIVGRKGTAGEVVYIEQNCTPIDTTYYVKPVEAKRINLKFLFHILKMLDLPSLRDGAGVPGLNRTDVYTKKKIPLPPLDIQERIVAKIDGYQKITDAARQIVENYKPSIKINPDWPMAEVGQICDLMTGGTPTSTVKEYYEGGNIKWLVSGDIHQGEIFDCPNRITEKGMKNSNAKILPVNSVLIALNGQGKTRGTVALLRIEATCNQSIVSMNPKNKNPLLSEYLYFVLKGMYQQIRNITGDKERSGLSMAIIRNIKIPLAPIETQKQIVSQLETEHKIVNENKKLIEIFEKKISDTISAIWGKVEL